MNVKKFVLEALGAKTRHDTIGSSSVLASIFLSILTGALFL